MASQKKSQDALIALIKAVDDLQRVIGILHRDDPDYVKWLGKAQEHIKEAQRHMGSDWLPYP